MGNVRLLRQWQLQCVATWRSVFSWRRSRAGKKSRWARPQQLTATRALDSSTECPGCIWGSNGFTSCYHYQHHHCYHHHDFVDFDFKPLARTSRFDNPTTQRLQSPRVICALLCIEDSRASFSWRPRKKRSPTRSHLPQHSSLHVWGSGPMEGPTSRRMGSSKRPSKEGSSRGRPLEEPAVDRPLDDIFRRRRGRRPGTWRATQGRRPRLSHFHIVLRTLHHCSPRLPKCRAWRGSAQSVAQLAQIDVENPNIVLSRGGADAAPPHRSAADFPQATINQPSWRSAGRPAYGEEVRKSARNDTPSRIRSDCEEAAPHVEKTIPTNRPIE